MLRGWEGITGLSLASNDTEEGEIMEAFNDFTGWTAFLFQWVGTCTCNLYTTRFTALFRDRYLGLTRCLSIRGS